MAYVVSPRWHHPLYVLKSEGSFNIIFNYFSHYSQRVIFNLHRPFASRLWDYVKVSLSLKILFPLLSKWPWMHAMVKKKASMRFMHAKRADQRHNDAPMSRQQKDLALLVGIQLNKQCTSTRKIQRNRWCMYDRWRLQIIWTDMMEMTLGRGLKDGPHECVECENSTEASVIRGSRGKIVCKDMERRAWALPAPRKFWVEISCIWTLVIRLIFEKLKILFMSSKKTENNLLM
jgi:hypothetical protein